MEKQRMKQWTAITLWFGWLLMPTVGVVFVLFLVCLWAAMNASPGLLEASNLLVHAKPRSGVV